MMLDHLDDPIPFIPDETFRAQVQRRSRRLRRRHRLARAAAVIAVFGLVVAGGGLYVLRRDAAIHRVDVSTQPSTDGATNVLVVGPDQSGGNADSIIVLRIEPTGAVRLLSIPRDLWDPQTHTRINAAYREGVQSLIDSVDRLTGVPIDHFVEVDFDGFVDLVDEVGGLSIAIDQPMRNQPTGLRLDASECATLDGETLLALVRARHLEYLHPDGAWRADPTADQGRIARAQTLMTIALGKLAEAGTDPATVDRYSRILADHALLDDGLTLSRLVGLAHAITTAGPTRTTSDTLPVEATSTPEGAHVLRLAPGADQVLDRYGSADGDGPADIAPTASQDPVVPFAPC